MYRLSQRDSRWANIEVGTGGRSIGQVGCTITCLAMIGNTTPDIVNQKLKAVNGYAQGNLVLWTKIKEALPQLQFLTRGYAYDNAVVAKNLPCLVEVNGAPIGGFRHWVVFIGNQRLYDPWDGLEKTTGVYQTTGFAVIKSQVAQIDYDAKLNQIRDIINSEGSSQDRFNKIKTFFV